MVIVIDAKHPLPQSTHKKLKRIADSGLDDIDRRGAIHAALVELQAKEGRHTSDADESSQGVPSHGADKRRTPQKEAVLAEPEEVLAALYHAGWQGRATYDIRPIVLEVMAWQTYECHKDAEHFLATYSGVTVSVTSLPSRRTYRCTFGWQKAFMPARDVMRIQALLLVHPFQLCPVGMVNGKTLLMSPQTRQEGEREGKGTVPTLFFVSKPGGKKLGLVGDNIVTVISWFARDSSAKVCELPKHFYKLRGH